MISTKLERKQRNTLQIHIHQTLIQFYLQYMLEKKSQSSFRGSKNLYNIRQAPPQTTDSDQIKYNTGLIPTWLKITCKLNTPPAFIHTQEFNLT